MKFAEWMRRHDVKVRKFADVAQVDERTVEGWINGTIKPTEGDKMLVAELTRGAVSIRSWDNG